jgi:diacylglycerol kinase family enzyme
MPARSSITVILNAGAGTAKARPQIETELRKLFVDAGCQVEIISPQPGQDPVEVARAAARHASIVVAAGGDGTISSVAAAIIESPAALAVLPLGSRNHFAKDLRIPLALGDAVATIAAGHVAQIDVGRVNDRVFINNSSIGIYPGMVEQREQLREQGHRKWPAMAIATWRMLTSYPGMSVTLDADGDVRTRRTPFVFVGNNEYAIDGLRVGGRSGLEGGKLFACLTPRMRTRDLPALVLKSLIGRAGQSGAFEIIRACELTISARAVRVRVAIDGEVETMNLPLRYRACPRALRVVLPQP